MKATNPYRPTGKSYLPLFAVLPRQLTSPSPSLLLGHSFTARRHKTIYHWLSYWHRAGRRPFPRWIGVEWNPSETTTNHKSNIIISSSHIHTHPPCIDVVFIIQKGKKRNNSHSAHHHRHPSNDLSALEIPFWIWQFSSRPGGGGLSICFIHDGSVPPPTPPPLGEGVYSVCVVRKRRNGVVRRKMLILEVEFSSLGTEAIAPSPLHCCTIPVHSHPSPPGRRATVPNAMQKTHTHTQGGHVVVSGRAILSLLSAIAATHRCHSVVL